VLAARALAAQLIEAGDKDHDGTLSQQEWTAVADNWFEKLDTGQTGKVSRADFVAHLNSLLPRPAHVTESKPVRQWRAYNALIGGYFKFHRPDPQLIYVKIDDPNSPLTTMFHGEEIEIHHETYRSRRNRSHAGTCMC
jgi:hypothetical protein